MTFAVSSIESYLYLCMKLRAQGRFWMFRGQRDARWEVCTRVSEATISKDEYLRAARDGVDVFRGSVEGTEECQALGADPWKWLFFAQHKGVPTPLLDWSSNPLVALYFAVEDVLSDPALADTYGAVWALTLNAERKRSWYGEGALALGDPWVIDDLMLVNPPPSPAVVRRLARQSGKFTFHPDQRPIHEHLEPGEELIQIGIRDTSVGTSIADVARRLRFQLGTCNIHHGSLFPESENMARYYNTQWKHIASPDFLGRNELVWCDRVRDEIQTIEANWPPG